MRRPWLVVAYSPLGERYPIEVGGGWFYATAMWRRWRVRRHLARVNVPCPEMRIVWGWRRAVR